jgi:hypothetical protein
LNFILILNIAFPANRMIMKRNSVLQVTLNAKNLLHEMGLVGENFLFT